MAYKLFNRLYYNIWTIAESYDPGSKFFIYEADEYDKKLFKL
jgi:UDP-N-acetylmuramate-alanine ligase